MISREGVQSLGSRRPLRYLVARWYGRHWPGLAAIVLLAGACAGAPLRDSRIAAREERPIYAGGRLLAGRDLTVEIMDPDDPGRYYIGTRFTPVAAVIRATLGGREFLMSRPDHDRLTDVAGLFAEFDLITSPPGFAEAAVGEPFVKIGVGALVKSAGGYRFYSPYSVYREAITSVEWGRASARFTQTLSPVNGYGYLLRAKVAVSGRSLVIDWSLKNTGAKPFQTEQYLHNCFAPDNRALKPGTVVTFPFRVGARSLSAQERQVGNEIRFDRDLPAPVNIDVNYPAGYAGSNVLSVVSPVAGLAMDCATSIPGSRIALHVRSEDICPEQFVTIRLDPGQTRTWARRYTFRQTR